MDKEEQRKVVEGLILLVEDIKKETEKVISLEDFEETKYNLRVLVCKKGLEIIEGLNYFPHDECRRLNDLYSVAIQNTESVFGTVGDYKQNLKELMDIIK